MSELDRGDRSEVVRGDVGEQNGAWSPGFGPGDAKALGRGLGVELARGVQSPLSARNRASISKARRRAASACCELGGGSGPGGAGGEVLGA